MKTEDFTKPYVSYTALHNMKWDVCKALGLDPEKHAVMSVNITSGGFTLKTQPNTECCSDIEHSQHFFLPTKNFQVGDWIDVTDEIEHCS